MWKILMGWITRYARMIFWSWVAFILYMTFAPGAAVDLTHPGGIPFRLDYVLHLVAYFMLYAWFFLTVQSGKPALKPVFLGYIVIIVLGAGTELVQIYVPWRAFNIFDLMYNIAGILIAGITFRILAAYGIPVKAIRNSLNSNSNIK